MIDATYLKAHPLPGSTCRACARGARRRACGRKRRPGDKRGRLISRTKGGLKTKLRAVTAAKGRPLKFFMTAGQVSDYTGAAALLGSPPAAEWMIAGRGYRAGKRHRFERTGEGQLGLRCVERQGDTPLHPRPEVARQSCPLSQAALSPSQPHRDHVRSAERLA